MKNDYATFLHVTVFLCPTCGLPMVVPTMSAEQSLERVDGSILEASCRCGWSGNSLGMHARYHWVGGWQ